MQVAWPLGAPGWRFVARLGFPIWVHILVQQDEEAGVYVATSSQVPGLAVEGESLDAVKAEVDSALPALLNLDYSPLPRPPRTDILIRDTHCMA